MSIPKSYRWDIPKQTFLADPEKKQKGDCWRCAIAAVLQIPAESVPHFLQLSLDEDTHDCDPRTQEWLNERGFLLIESARFIFPAKYQKRPQIPVIACGPTPRSRGLGKHHAVVMVGDEIVYDPHPDNSGLTAITDRYLVVPMPT